MDTNRLKRFAAGARAKLKDGVAARMAALGFDRNGNVAERLAPRPVQGGTLMNGRLLPAGFYLRWTALRDRVRRKGVAEVCEEAAYTWFNRLCAVTILRKNGLCAPVLDYADAARTPVIVDEARQGRLPRMEEEARACLAKLLDDDTKVTEQFAVLINAWCRDNPVVHKCFGAMEDYTELLLPADILAEGGFVDMLNRDGFILEEDYASTELIGWLYQFYIAERKGAVFAAKGKIKADDIPAATQIFTPAWIVKYMVQNTVGRVYLDGNPCPDLEEGMEYLVEAPAATAPAGGARRPRDIRDFTCADLACGSGHILNECFDVLYRIYIHEGYGRRRAVEEILRRNLTGVDIDARAGQLATFALLLKACQKDGSFADGHCMPRVLWMPEPWDDERDGDIRDALHRFFRGREDGRQADELAACFALMRDADSLGSLMKFSLGDDTRRLLRQAVEQWQEEAALPEEAGTLMPAMQLILALTEKYHALVMNPPYMGGGNMNDVLGGYVKRNYPEGKADLCTAFMIMQAERTSDGGYYANIVPPSWMFLSTFEDLRRSIIENGHIVSLLHLSRGVFGADFGSVCTVVQNRKAEDARGTYFRLIERTFQEFDQKHLKLLFEQTLANHDFRYKFTDYNKDVTELPYSEDGNKIYYPDIRQDSFEKIPGCPIGYWVSEKMIEAFSNHLLSSLVPVKKGLDTGNNDYFLKMWHEVLYQKIGIRKTKGDFDGYKWAPHDKGGTFRRWYGNNEWVINWEHDGTALRESTANLRSEQFYFKKAITWNSLSSGKISFRLSDNGAISNTAGSSLFPKEEQIVMLTGLLNTNVIQYCLDIISPTLNYSAGSIGMIPIIIHKDNIISRLVQENISISRLDWDAHETSWDFQRNGLLDIGGDAPGEARSLEERVEQYKRKWETLFFRLHDNEEELNRLFIDTYGLQDELTPDVPLDEITILQQDEISFG